MKISINITLLSLLLSMQSNLSYSSNERTLEQAKLEASINKNLLEVTTDMQTIKEESRGGQVSSTALGKLMSNAMFIPLLSPTSPNKTAFEQANNALLQEVQKINFKKSPNAAIRQFFTENP